MYKNPEEIKEGIKDAGKDMKRKKPKMRRLDHYTPAYREGYLSRFKAKKIGDK